jgi:hypothetical protein
MVRRALVVFLCAGLLAAGALASFAQSTTGTAANKTAACVSGVQWTRGEQESPEMHPGRSCIDCHAQGEGPKFLLAGTVFTQLTEPDDCYGVQGVTVTITDAKKQVITLTSNASGNFFYGGRGPNRDAAVTFPISVKLTFKGKTRVMESQQSIGTCNACHTAKGENGAPGRIIAPST